MESASNYVVTRSSVLRWLAFSLYAMIDGMFTRGSGETRSDDVLKIVVTATVRTTYRSTCVVFSPHYCCRVQSLFNVQLLSGSSDAVTCWGAHEPNVVTRFTFGGSN
jgi:hypothetical protein